MSLQWIHEERPTWDADKRRIVGGAPAGVFDRRLVSLPEGADLPGDWFRVEEDGRTVGYGWMDVEFGEAEVLLAVDPEHLGRGVGAFIVERLKEEARKRGLNYVTNIVRPTHPDRERVTRFLERQGFVAMEDGSLRARTS